MTTIILLLINLQLVMNFQVTLEKIDFDTGDVYTVENLFQEGLKDGDYVMFMEVPYLPNEMEPVKITIKS